ncbi:hypothetical protein C8R45DRAFT_1113277 [Mycena sanguinolenta]|nr:hypothetical protein C8R45DRAFT_1113277 [Mycena sanguinolenta]
MSRFGSTEMRRGWGNENMKMKAEGNERRDGQGWPGMHGRSAHSSTRHRSLPFPPIVPFYPYPLLPLQHVLTILFSDESGPAPPRARLRHASAHSLKIAEPRSASFALFARVRAPVDDDVAPENELDDFYRIEDDTPGGKL